MKVFHNKLHFIGIIRGLFLGFFSLSLHFSPGATGKGKNYQNGLT